ncbi:hypothetical protein [Sigmofec virus UA08Rod_4331]|uniref:Uncharacterized protein n=1 Tax=Sigmofec virus UA08Rod_4331 TaxID=2929399 RepID=A0A976R827_9VIRU|nr:hypothetical protein [Sigmofec virus UA08Rod_4331]
MKANFYKFENCEKFEYILNTSLRGICLSNNVDKDGLFIFDDIMVDEITQNMAEFTLLFKCINCKKVYMPSFILRFSCNFKDISISELKFVFSDITYNAKSPTLASLDKIISDIVVLSDLSNINIVKSIKF